MIRMSRQYLLRAVELLSQHRADQHNGGQVGAPNESLRSARSRHRLCRGRRRRRSEDDFADARSLVARALGEIAAARFHVRRGDDRAAPPSCRRPRPAAIPPRGPSGLRRSKGLFFPSSTLSGPGQAAWHRFRAGSSPASFGAAHGDDAGLHAASPFLLAPMSLADNARNLLSLRPAAVTRRRDGRPILARSSCARLAPPSFRPGTISLARYLLGKVVVQDLPEWDDGQPHRPDRRPICRTMPPATPFGGRRRLNPLAVPAAGARLCLYRLRHLDDAERGRFPA